MEFFETPAGYRVKNAIIGVGASIVLLGALFKLQHWPGAGLMLIIGMSIEAFIFFFQGVILPYHKDYHWEKIFPGLDIAPELEKKLKRKGKLPQKNTTATNMGNALASAFARMTSEEEADTQLQLMKVADTLDKAKLSDEVIERIGTSINRLSETLGKLTQVADAASATEEYAQKAKEASEELERLREAFEEVVAVSESFKQTSEVQKEYSTRLKQTSGTLSELHLLYSEEVREARQFTDVLSHYRQSLEQNASVAAQMGEGAQRVVEVMGRLTELYEKTATASATSTQALENINLRVNELLNGLEEAIEATRKYREGLASLAEHVETLNRIYGNMVSAVSMVRVSTGS